MNRSRYFETAVKMDEALLSLLDEKEFEYITVKEICARANVNRSTFYLHYETIGDLLAETMELISSRFYEGHPSKEPEIEDSTLDELYFITDDRILPYLNFVRENRKAYRAIHENPAVFDVDGAFRRMLSEVFSPILSRYGVDEARHGYIMGFYRGGLTAVVMKWVEGGCAEPPEEIAEIIKTVITK